MIRIEDCVSTCCSGPITIQYVSVEDHGRTRNMFTGWKCDVCGSHTEPIDPRKALAKLHGWIKDMHAKNPPDPSGD